jgi:hypothetical protein
MRIAMPWLAVASLTILLFPALPAAVAHHSVVQIFDSQSIVTVNGIVTEMHWGNPHVYVQMAVKKDGKTDDWVVELGSMFNLERMGWTRQRVRVGDPLTITGWRGKPAKVPYLGATIDPSGLPRLLRLTDAEFGDGTKYTIAAGSNAN